VYALFHEKVYRNALAHELRKMGLNVICRNPIKVYYDNVLVGEYYADLVVESAVIVELKAVETLHKRHSNQLINYLRATEMEVGLLLNFGAEPQVVRKIFQNDRKKISVNPLNPC
jgi:GxxExxY protein